MAAGSVVVRDGTRVAVRSIDPGDADRLMRFHEGLSSETTRYRFFSPHPRLSASEVQAFTNVDHERSEAIVAIEDDEIIGVARYVGLATPHEAEAAFVVADRWQHRGLGTALFFVLAKHARAHDVERFVIETLYDNEAMIRLVERSAYSAVRSLEHGVVHFVVELVPIDAD